MTLPLSFIAASRQMPYIYVNNFKCGCSTIRRTLWASEHALGMVAAPLHPHIEVQLTPFINDQQRWEHVDSQFVFTFVRNPYARVLSAFLDKIVRREPPVWGPFAERHGLGEGEISFLEFLRLVASEPPETMDIHWRPQRLIIGTDIVPYNFVGAMETFASDLAHLTHRLFGPNATIEDFVPHRTQASDRLEQYYGTEERAIVADLFREDFAALGYATDFNRLERAQAAWPSVDAGPLRTWGRANRLVAEHRFAEAAAAIESVQDRLDAPVVQSTLVHCYCEIARQREFAGPQIMSYLRKLHHLTPASPGTWKGYSDQLLAAGKLEESLEAEIEAVTLRDGGSGRKAKRCRKLRRTLAMMRARQGRRAEALAALRPPSTERAPGAVETVLGTMDVAKVFVVATAARVIAAVGRQPPSARPDGTHKLNASAAAGTADPGDR